MRENIGIFRGKRIDTGQWKEGYLLGLQDKISGKDLFFIVYEMGEYHRVDPETVGEFTGLTDKNGVKTFEGDILESFYKKKRIVSVVKYGAFEPEFFYECAEAQGFFLYGMKLYGLYAYDLAGSEMMLVEDMRKAKIIGNIHDTPELLGGDNNAAD
jgi:uncharacterized phage protein (TIGR01671 family)